MSHVDEGALHAYLDGALDEYPAAEAGKVREHLEACAACRSRLEAERAIRDRAASILSAAVPSVDVPTLEDLRSYVRAREPSPRPRAVRLYRLGWAASVALAVGAGWVLRGGGSVPLALPVDTGVAAARQTTDDGSSSVPGGSVPQAGSELVATTEPDFRDAVPATPEPVRLGDDALLPSRTPIASVARGGALGQSGVRVEDTSATDVIVDLDADAPPLPEAPRLQDTVLPFVITPEILVDAGDSDGDAGGRLTGAAPGRVLTSASSAGAGPGLDGLGPTLDASGVGDAGPAEDGEEESYSLVVPGLAVLDVRFRGTGVRPEGQVALQRLESGDTLTVIHVPREIELSSLDAPADGDRQIVVQTASGWIVMRAPVGEDTLLDLMRRLLSAR